MCPARARGWQESCNFQFWRSVMKTLVKMCFSLATLLFLSSPLSAGSSARYRIDLQDGSRVYARDLPVRRGTILTFHQHPGGVSDRCARRARPSGRAGVRHGGRGSQDPAEAPGRRLQRTSSRRGLRRRSGRGAATGRGPRPRPDGRRRRGRFSTATATRHRRRDERCDEYRRRAGRRLRRKRQQQRRAHDRPERSARGSVVDRSLARPGHAGTGPDGRGAERLSGDELADHDRPRRIPGSVSGGSRLQRSGRNDGARARDRTQRNSGPAHSPAHRSPSSARTALRCWGSRARREPRRR